MKRVLNRALWAALLGVCTSAVPAFAVVVPAQTPLTEKSFRQPDLFVPEVNEPLSALPSLAAALKQELEELGVATDQGFYDPRSGHWSSLILSRPLIPGAGAGNKLRWDDLAGSAPRDQNAIKDEVAKAVQAYLRRDGKVAMGGDGQVTVGETVMKARATKVRALSGGQVLAGFAGAAADAFTLFEKFEEKLERFPGNLPRAAVLGALSAWTQAGRAIYDLNKHVYRARELSREPLPMDKLRFSNEREAAATELCDQRNANVKTAKVDRDGSITLDGAVKDKSRMYTPSLFIDGDARITRAICTCNFYQQNKLFKGPCEHILALRIQHSRQRSS